jgi:hypothetical protein
MARTYRKASKKRWSNYQDNDTIDDKDIKRMRVDGSCANNGSCDYCKSNRTHRNRRRKPVDEWEY